MFKHILLNRLKYYTRDKNSVFWLLMFPIILASFFQLALTNILNDEGFEAVELAIVDDAQWKDQTMFRQIIEAVSVIEGEGDTNTHTPDIMFYLRYVTREAADRLLESGDVSGYLYAESEAGSEECIKIMLKTNGIAQTIIKEFVDFTSHRMAAVNDIYSRTDPKNKEQGDEMPYQAIFDTKTFIEAKKVSENEPNLVVAYFYTILAMASLYGALIGVNEIILLQANLSPLGVRINVAPISKMKTFLASFFACVIVQTIVLFLLLLYIMIVLGVDFGSRMGLVMFTTLIGGITGISFGGFIGAMNKKSEKYKTALILAITMFCCYLAGMMDSAIKYKVKAFAPLVDRINPANLITESYYKLYYYDDLSMFWENIYILLIMIILFFAGTVIVLRRRRYDSI